MDSTGPEFNLPPCTCSNSFYTRTGEVSPERTKAVAQAIVSFVYLFLFYFSLAKLIVYLVHLCMTALHTAHTCCRVITVKKKKMIEKEKRGSTFF